MASAKLQKLISWNVNGIRAAIRKDILNYLQSSKFSAICFQEVRALESQFPDEFVNFLNTNNLYSNFYAAEKKGYSGVGIISVAKPLSVTKGIGVKEFDCEGRVITCEFENYILSSAYFPNSQDMGKRLSYKLRFCDHLFEFLTKQKEKLNKPVILGGDYNIAHREIDIARPKANEKTAGYFLEERQWMEYLTVDKDWIDTFRFLNPDKKDVYSWWSQRGRARENNVGWRIDYFCTDKSIKKNIKKAEVEYNVLGSDHCPVTLEVDL